MSDQPSSMDVRDDSDLTSLESEDEYQAKTTKKTTEKPEYSIRNALKPPRATTYSAQALYDAMVSEDINLDADYQRDVVWQDTKQIALIDSIYRNFYVPPVIFASKTHDDGSETKVCIDGKQRLTSIRRFMDGFIPHKDHITSEKWWYKDDSGPATSSRTRKKLIGDKMRKNFANKQIVCVEYQEITDSDERDIFQRVQLGMALTPAEKLQVINTPRSQFARTLVLQHVAEGGLAPAGGNIEWDSSRGADFRCVASALWCIDKWSSIKTVPSVMNLEKWLDEEDGLDDDLSAKASETFLIYDALASDKKLGKVFRLTFGSNNTKVAPLEFVLTAAFIAAYKDELSMKELSVGIEKMRQDVRKHHVDVRLNSRVGKTMIDFIKGYKASAKSEGDVPAAVAIRNASKDGKRKRSEGGVGSGDESEPGKAASKKQKAVVKQEEPAPRPPPTQAESTSRIAALRASRSNAAAGSSSLAPPLPSASAAGSSSHLPSPPISSTPQQSTASWSQQQAQLQGAGTTGSWQSQSGRYSGNYGDRDTGYRDRDHRENGYNRDRDRSRDRRDDRDRRGSYSRSGGYR